MRLQLTLAALSAIALVSCSGDDPPPASPDPFLAALAGTWQRCDDGAIPDRFEQLTFSGTSVHFIEQTHTTSDGSCGGPGTVVSDDQGTIVLGGELAATMRNAQTVVTARAVDVALQGKPVMYTLLYLDAGANPDILYKADEDSSDPAHDGETPATRHDLVKDSDPYLKQ